MITKLLIKIVSDRAIDSREVGEGPGSSRISHRDAEGVFSAPKKASRGMGLGAEGSPRRGVGVPMGASLMG